MEPANQERQLIEQGAEAKIYKCKHEGQECILKERLPKKYRHPDLDRKLSTQRINSVPFGAMQQTKIMALALNHGMAVPHILRVDMPNRSFFMEYIHGLKLKDWLRSNPSKPESQREMIGQMGRIIQQLHGYGIIHGDLTTSNMIVKDERIFLIDFGLSYIKNSAEDKAVDLYVLERAFVSTHPELQKQFEHFYEYYKDQQTLRRLEKVRQRGRKKVAFG